MLNFTLLDDRSSHFFSFYLDLLSFSYALNWIVQKALVLVLDLNLVKHFFEKSKQIKKIKTLNHSYLKKQNKSKCR